MVPADLRKYDLSCTLRVHETQPARTRVAGWVSKAVEEWGLSVSGGVIGEVWVGRRRLSRRRLSRRRRCVKLGERTACTSPSPFLRSPIAPSSPVALFLCTLLVAPYRAPLRAWGQVNTGQRREINLGYFRTLGQAKVIVTCNPSNWEGDFRLWEAMATGALVFVDEMATPMPHAPVDGEHIIVYDNRSGQGGGGQEGAGRRAKKGIVRVALACHSVLKYPIGVAPLATLYSSTRFGASRHSVPPPSNFFLRGGARAATSAASWPS